MRWKDRTIDTVVGIGRDQIGDQLCYVVRRLLMWAVIEYAYDVGDQND